MFWPWVSLRSWYGRRAGQRNAPSSQCLLAALGSLSPSMPCFHSILNAVALFSLWDTVAVLSVQMHWNLRGICSSFGLNLIPSSVQRYPGATTVYWRLRGWAPALDQTISILISFINWGSGAGSYVGKVQGFKQCECQQVTTSLPFLVSRCFHCSVALSLPHTSLGWPSLWLSPAKL